MKNGSSLAYLLLLLIVKGWAYGTVKSYSCEPALGTACFPFGLGTKSSTSTANLQACRVWCEKELNTNIPDPEKGYCCSFLAGGKCMMTNRGASTTKKTTKHPRHATTSSMMCTQEPKAFTASAGCNWAAFPKSSTCAANEGITCPNPPKKHGCDCAVSPCSDKSFRDAKRIEDIRIPLFEKLDLSIDHPLQAMVDLNFKPNTEFLRKKHWFIKNGCTASKCEINKACDMAFHQGVACWPLKRWQDGKLNGWMRLNVPMVGERNRPGSPVVVTTKVGVLPLDSTGFLHHNPACHLNPAQTAGVGPIPAGCNDHTNWASAASAADLKAMPGYNGRAAVVVLKRTFCVKTPTGSTCHSMKLSKCWTCDNKVFNAAVWFAKSAELDSFVNGGCINQRPCGSIKGHRKETVCKSMAGGERASCMHCNSLEGEPKALCQAHDKGRAAVMAAAKVATAAF